MITAQKPSLTLISFHRDGETLDPATQQNVKDLTLKINRSGHTALQFTRGIVSGKFAVLTDAVTPDAIDLKIALFLESGNDEVVTFRVEGLTPEMANVLAYGIRTETKSANKIAVLFTPSALDAEVNLAHWSANPGPKGRRSSTDGNARQEDIRASVG